MNKFTLLIAALFTAATLRAQTAIPNGGFESWTTNKPTVWDATNFQFGIIPLQTVFKDTVNPMQGSCNALIQTKTFNLGIAQPTIPGLITLGTVNVNMTNFTGTVEGGIPFTGRPVALKGFINAQPAAGDSAMVAIGFSKWSGTGRDTIGNGLAWFATPHNEWVTLDIPVVFYDPQQPDSMNIIISSSAIGNNVYVAGSQVRVDSLMFDYGSIMVEEPIADPEFRVWADAGRQLCYAFDPGFGTPVAMNIFQPNGTEVLSAGLAADGASGSISLRDLAAGVYIVRIITTGHRVFSRKFVVK